MLHFYDEVDPQQPYVETQHPGVFVYNIKRKCMEGELAKKVLETLYPKLFEETGAISISKVNGLLRAFFSFSFRSTITEKEEGVYDLHVEIPLEEGSDQFVTVDLQLKRQEPVKQEEPQVIDEAPNVDMLTDENIILPQELPANAEIVTDAEDAESSFMDEEQVF